MASNASDACLNTLNIRARRDFCESVACLRTRAAQVSTLSTFARLVALSKAERALHETAGACLKSLNIRGHPTRLTPSLRVRRAGDRPMALMMTLPI